MPSRSTRLRTSVLTVERAPLLPSKARPAVTRASTRDVEPHAVDRPTVGPEPQRSVSSATIAAAFSARSGSPLLGLGSEAAMPRAVSTRFVSPPSRLPGRPWTTVASADEVERLVGARAARRDARRLGERRMRSSSYVAAHARVRHRVMRGPSGSRCRPREQQSCAIQVPENQTAAAPVEADAPWPCRSHRWSCPRLVANSTADSTSLGLAERAIRTTRRHTHRCAADERARQPETT